MGTYNSFNEMATANGTIAYGSNIVNAAPAETSNATSYAALSKEVKQLAEDYYHAKDMWYGQQSKVYGAKDAEWEMRFGSKVSDYDEATEKAKLEEWGNKQVALRDELAAKREELDKLESEAWGRLASGDPITGLAYASAMSDVG